MCIASAELNTDLASEYLDYIKHILKILRLLDHDADLCAYDVGETARLGCVMFDGILYITKWSDECEDNGEMYYGPISVVWYKIAPLSET